MADMIKFYKGLEASLPAVGTNGALYITTDEGAIYLGTGTGMKRLGDFIQVANVEALPAKAHESCLYYCVAENILAKWNGTEWKQINKQPTAEEMKTFLGLGALAYKSEVAEGDLNADLKAKIDASTAVNHSHDNKALLDTYTQTETDLADAVAKKHAHANADELAKFVDGDKAKYDAVVADHLTSADKTTLENAIAAEKERAEGIEGGLDARIKAVEDDYLVGADKTKLAGLITAEETRAKGVEESLQTQINTIMNNPDAEGAINSINEFTQYVKDHGTIAEGFRTDIDKNKEDIAANAKAIADQATSDAATYETKTDASAKLTEAKEHATGLNTAMDTRVKVLEAIDHDAYIGADATLKTELQAEIDADVKVVNDALEAYKTSNDAEVAKKANSADVYAKTETYTKSEIEALLTWSEF